MKSFLGFALLAAVCAANAQTPPPAAATPDAPAEAPKGDFLKGIDVSGWFDLYYQYSFKNPGANLYGPIFGNLNGRQLDVRTRAISLNEARINVTKPTSGANTFGFTLSLAAGGATDIIHANEPGGPDGIKIFQQAYATYAGPNGLTVDAGKYLTWIGLEGVNTPFNDNYSLDFSFFIAQPTYHTGLRALQPLGSGLTLGLYAVQGWNEVVDSNTEKSYGSSLNYAFPGGKGQVNLAYYGGVEGRPFNATNTNFGGIFSNGTTRVNLGDLILSYQVTPRLKLAFDGDYGDFTATSGAQAGALNGKVTAAAFYAKYALAPKLSTALRYESVNDARANSAFANTLLSSLTGTLDYAASDALLFRFELRQDWANKLVFEGRNGAGSERERFTTTFAVAYKF